MPRHEKADPAIVEALGLDEARTAMTQHGSSGFASTYKITSSSPDGAEWTYFIKTGRGPESQVMFRGEYASLNAINAVDPTFCPRAHAHGELASRPGTFFLATDFVSFGSSSSSSSRGSASFAAKLARMHSAPVPPWSPADDDNDEGDTPAAANTTTTTPPSDATLAATAHFGFPVTTCCGATPQDNTPEPTWPRFFARRRLLAALDAIRRQQGGGAPDPRVDRAVRAVASDVVPRLLGALGNVKPALCHGDLWSGNISRGTILPSKPLPSPSSPSTPDDDKVNNNKNNDGGGERSAAAPGTSQALVYDASCVYGHSEYDFGISMFGGFDRAFFDEYHKLVPRSEPAREFDDRVKLYQLYHYLNHYALFGSSYRGQCLSIAEDLLAKYSKGSTA